VKPKLDTIALYTAASLDFESHSVLDKVARPGGEWLSFEISATESGPFSFMQSLSGSPGLYLGEMLRRCLGSATRSPLVLFNPIAMKEENSLNRILSLLDEAKGKVGLTLFSDLTGFPLAYVIPWDLCERLKSDLYFFRFLSCTNAELDRLLLSLLFAQEVQINVIPYPIGFDHKSGFIYESCQIIPAAMASHCITALRALKNPAGSYYQTLKAQSEIPKIAIYPYHAGDVLFVTQALKKTEHPYDYLMVCEDYAEIARESFPGINLIKIPGPPFMRGANKTGSPEHSNLEHLYFHEVLRPALPANSLFQYLRPFRDYSYSHDHLMDQLQFAISSDQKWTGVHQTQVPAQITYPRPASKSVLIHYDAGWSLKIYPSHFQSELIDRLEKMGYAVSILADNPSQYKQASYKFESITQLKKLIQSHSIFVAMDSFPAHFAAFSLRHPTICLFGSTRPSNSNQRRSAVYEDLSKEMECAPCSQIAVCPKYDLNYCTNFAEPKHVAESVQKMFSECYSI